MSFLDKYLGDQNLAVANGDLANLANLPVEIGVNKPNSTNIVSKAVVSLDRAKAAVRSAAREARRQQVLQMMAEDDQCRKYHWFTDDKAHPDCVILVFAIRDVGTGELNIPREKYDPFLLMEILDKHNSGGEDS